MKNSNTPAQRLVRNAVSLLDNGTISPEHAFAMVRFAADGSDDPKALAELARMYNNGIGCEKDHERAIDLLRRSGIADFLLGSASARLDPWEEDYTMDEDEIDAKEEEENRIVDAFLESEWTDVAARYARYDPANTGCNPDDPIVITGDICEVWENLELAFLLHGIPSRYVQYEVEKRRTSVRDGRYIDHVRVRVSTYPLLAEAADGELYIPASKFLGYEDYWFDVQDCYDRTEEFMDTIHEEYKIEW